MGAVSPRPLLVKAQSPGSPASAGDKPSPITKLSISRNYVIPPRPKPGRKPSNDIPPSRRKAQNRDAQRAFRERKSQAVRALEDQLAKQAQEFEKQQSLMREQIMVLQRQTGKQHIAASDPVACPPPYGALSGSGGSAIGGGFLGGSGSQDARPPPQSPGYTVSSPGSGMSSPGLSSSGVTTPQSQTNLPAYSPIQFKQVLPAAAPTHGFQVMPLTLMPPQQISSPQSPGSPFGTPVTPADVAGLELLDHVLDQKLPVQQGPASPSKLGRRASRSSKTSPDSPLSPGVVRLEPPPVASTPLELVNTSWSQPAVPLRRKSSALEVDFTLAFTPKSPRKLSLPSPPALRDRCGFCTDNTPCICAASAAREEGADMAPDLATLGSPLGPSDGMSSFGADSLFKARRPSLHLQPTELARATEKTAQSPGAGTDDTNGCTGNPGNCSQCRQDPMLTLFCSAVASKPPTVRTPSLGTYIPAQAAYKTLSRHPRFCDADLGEVVNILLVKSSQVEVNSVAKVLRLLDAK